MEKVLITGAHGSPHRRGHVECSHSFSHALLQGGQSTEQLSVHSCPQTNILEHFSMQLVTE